MSVKYYVFIILPVECSSAPLGMESRAIPDSAVTASSTWDSRLQPWQARINNEHCWSAGTSVVGEWLQVDLGKDTAVTKVATQGRSTSGQWVKSYKILFSLDEANWNEYQIGGVVKVNIVNVRLFLNQSHTATEIENKCGGNLKKPEAFRENLNGKWTTVLVH